MKYPHPKYPKFAFWWTSVKYSLIYFMTSGYLSLNGWIEISKTKTVTHLPLFMVEYVNHLSSISFKKYNTLWISMLLMSLVFVLLWCTQWTHLRRFAIDSTSKLHVENSSRFHQFQNGNAQGNYDTNSTWKFRHGFNIQNW